MALGLFKAAAPQPVTERVQRTDREIYLDLIAEAEEGITRSKTDEAKAIWREKLNDAKYRLGALGLPTVAPSPTVVAIELIQKLDQRRKVLDMETEWLDFWIDRAGGKATRNQQGYIVTCTGLPVETYTLIEQNLTEMEETVKAIEKDRRRESKRLRTPREQKKDRECYPGPIAPVGYKACALPDGTYNHVSSVAPEDNTEEVSTMDHGKLRMWAESFGVDDATYTAHLGTVSERSGTSKNVRTVLVLLQERIRQIVIARKKGEQKDMGLFTKPALTEEKKQNLEAAKQQAQDGAEALIAKKLDKTSNEIALEALNQALVEHCEQEKRAAERIKTEARDALGITWSKPVETVKDVTDLLRVRRASLTELEDLINSYNEIKPELEARIESFDRNFRMTLQQWHEANPTENGTKSRKLLTGTIGTRDKAASAAQNDEPSEAQKQLWLKNLTAEQKEKFGVVAEAVYKYDPEKLKDWYFNEAVKGTPPVCPLYKFSPAVKDQFFIGPSIDTVKDNLRKANKR